MFSFEEILKSKMKEVPDFAGETTSGAGLSEELLRDLLNFKLEFSRKSTTEIPPTAHLYIRKSHETVMMRRKKFEAAWSALSPQHSKYYGVFKELGEWDFSPSDKLALKKCYRRLLRKLHPDVNQSVDAHQKTRNLIEAFAFLKGDGQ